MRKILKIAGVFFVLVLLMSFQVAAKKGCVTIQDGVLGYSAGHYLEGELLQTGYDPYGYNYQAHLFNGLYSNASRGAAGLPPSVDDDVKLQMKWNDAWLSNKDCDEDGLLDRYCGFDSYIGSGAWLTNHQSGTYIGDDGEICKWNYFVKIVAAPSDAYAEDGYWYTADDVEIGAVIWGSFAIIQSVYNDTGTGEHGIEYLSPVGPGFGKW